VLGTLRLPGPAGDVVTTRDAWWFVSTDAEVDALYAGGNVTGIVRRLRLPADLASGPHGLALTPDGRYLLVSAGSGAVVIDVARAEGGGPGRVLLGRLVSPVPSPTQDAGAATVRVSPDGRYVFVARERASGVAVFDLRVALRARLRHAGYLGRIPVGLGPIGMAFAPGGRWLYVTAMTPLPPAGLGAQPLQAMPGAGALGSPRGSVQLPARGPSAGGLLSVVDVARAEVDPGSSVVRAVHAGCEPVSVLASPDGRTVWVAALGDHAVLGFDARALLRRTGNSLASAVRVAEAPARLLAFAGGRRLLVADPTPGGGVTVIDARAALRHRPAVIGQIRSGAGAGPIALAPGVRALLVADAGFPTLELIRAPGLP
jgi:DNA-binding beta-propeller fold protein YncE